MKKFLFVSLLALVMTGCGVSDHLTRNMNQNQTNVVLNANNFKVVGSVRGEVSATYIFGIGGLSKAALENNAVSEMMKQADLQGGARAVVHVTLNEGVKMITPIYIERTMVAEGWVV